VTSGGHRAKKSLSQNFLVDPNLQLKIISSIDPGPDDRVLEIGPGGGALTQHLARAVGHLTVIELDDDLAAELQESYGPRDDVEVIHGDALGLSLSEIAGDLPLKVIGNIPYGITTPIIFHLLDQRPRPTLIVLTVQKEVAQRLAAKPGTKEYGALTVGVSTRCVFASCPGRRPPSDWNKRPRCARSPAPPSSAGANSCRRCSGRRRNTHYPAKRWPRSSNPWASIRPRVRTRCP
jgi:ribosomal RNA small subunit methyltransferase A